MKNRPLTRAPNKFSKSITCLTFSLLLPLWTATQATANQGLTHTLGSIGNQTVAEGELLDFSIQAPPTFGPDVRWTVSGLPESGVFYDVPAFPGAEGFGAATKGGRGGKVVKVTNLNRSGAGSLAAALALNEPRTVVFDVSGVIDGSLPAGEWIYNKADRIYSSASPVTIAGQTSPGGIALAGQLSMYTGDGGSPTDDVIMRFIRTRPDWYRNSPGDGIAVGGNRAVLDHVSGAWGNDEVFDLSNLKNASIQWCGIEESAGSGTEWEVFVDADADGMADSWERKVRDFSSTDTIDDFITKILPDRDLDGDGKSNIDEYTAGSNPLVANAGPDPDWDHLFDSDHDGLADWWEKKVIDYSTTDQLVSLSDVNPGDDPDGDLSTHLEEYLVGTNPLAKPSHNYGLIMAYGGKDISLHHNYFAHHSVRAPLFGVETTDFRNNVIYNVDLAVSSEPVTMNEQRPGQPYKINLVNNYFKAGPNAPKLLTYPLYFAPFVSGTSMSLYDTGSFFNMYDQPEGIYDIYSARRGISSGVIGPEPGAQYPAPEVVTQEAIDTYGLVLAHGGAIPKDSVTLRNLADIRSRTGKWGKGLPHIEPPMESEPPADMDNDGMADDWEQQLVVFPDKSPFNRGSVLSPSNGQDYNTIVKAGESVLTYNGEPVAGTVDRYKGYTYLEYYINELADRIVLRELYANGYDESALPGWNTVPAPGFIWTPGYDRAGTYTVVLTATDGHSTLSETIEIKVENTDRTPYIYPAMYTPAGTSLSTVHAASVEAAKTLEFEFYVADADGDDLKVRVENMPDGAYVVDTGKKETGLKGILPYDVYEFHWTPTTEDIGKTGSFLIVVEDANGTRLNSKSVSYKVAPPSNEVHALTVTHSSGGVVLPAGRLQIQENTDKLFTITPSDGYAVADVRLNGQSIGPVAAYLLKEVTSDTTLEVIFEYNPQAINGLILDLPFNDNFDDASGLGNHGVVANGKTPGFTTDRAGNSNGAALFDGVDDHVKILNNKYFDLSEYTMAAWINGLRDYQYSQYILSKNAKDGLNFPGMYAVRDSLYAAGNAFVNAKNILKDKENAWHHVAVTHEGRSVKVYLDGIPVGSGTNGYLETNTLNIIVGARSGALDAYLTSFFKGAIDDVKIYNNALTDAQIAKLAGQKEQLIETESIETETYSIVISDSTNGIISGNTSVNSGDNSSLTFTPDDGYEITDVIVDGIAIGIVGGYTFENVSEDHTIEVTFSRKVETESTINNGLVLKLDFNGAMTDSSGLGNNGSASATATPQWTNDRFGNPDSAGFFDGVNDYIEIPNGTDFNLPEYTLSVWIFGVKDFDAGQYIFSKSSSDSVDTPGLFAIWNGLYSNGTGYPHINKLMADMENKWLHLALVKKGASVEFFLNGVSQGVVTTGVTKNNSTNLIIGARAGASPPNFRFFKGAMDDIRIYNRALSADELLTLTNVSNGQ